MRYAVENQENQEEEIMFEPPLINQLLGTGAVILGFIGAGILARQMELHELEKQRKLEERDTKIIQAFNQEQRLIDEFGEVNNEHLRYYTKSLKVDSLLLRPAMALFKVLAYGVIVMYFGLSFEVLVLQLG